MVSEQSEKFPSLLVRSNDGERHFVVGATAVTIGRAADCEIVLDEPRASRRHASIRVEKHGASITDLGSRNGTRLNGRRLSDATHPLQGNDLITIGGTEIRYFVPAPAIESPAGANSSLTATLTDEAFSKSLLNRSLGATLVAGNASSLVSFEAEEALLCVVVSPSASPHLVLRENNVTSEFALGPDPLVIGRDAGADLELKCERASRRHAIVERHNAGHRIRDLGSRNGVHVNGVRVEEHELLEGDTIRIGAAVIVYKAGRHPQRRVARQAERRPVVFIPGFAGSELWCGNERLWPNLRKLLAGRDEFSAPAEVRGVVNEISIIPGLFKMESYGAFIRFLVKEVGYKPNTNLLEFAYDWRQDIRISARQLADSIRTWRSTRANPAERVTIIAHSMGGLVARYYLHHYQGAEAVERILFLGTPHRGSTRALALAVAGRGLLPFGLPSSRVKNVVCGFASLYQLLPMYDASFLQDGREFAPFSDDDWAPSEYRHHLETAVAFRRELDQDGGRLSIPHTCIFGYGQSTLARLRLQRDNRGSLTLNEQFFETTGDVAVLESSAALDGAEIHPVCQQHGALYADQDVRRRLQFELLERPRV